MYKFKSIYKNITTKDGIKKFFHLYIGIDTDIWGLPLSYSKVTDLTSTETSIRLFCFFAEWSVTRYTIN